jgi:hypothetical protein
MVLAATGVLFGGCTKPAESCDVALGAREWYNAIGYCDADAASHLTDARRETGEPKYLDLTLAAEAMRKEAFADTHVNRRGSAYYNAEDRRFIYLQIVNESRVPYLVLNAKHMLDEVQAEEKRLMP